MTNIAVAGSNQRILSSKHESTTNVKKLNAKLSRSRKVQNDDRSHSSDHMKRIHLNHLRSITDRLLKEQAKVSTPHSSPNEANDCSMPGNKNKSAQTTRKRDNRNGRIRMQTLEPWVESPPKDVQQNDAMTEHTTLCSAFEMLSFDNLCNGEKDSSPTDSTSVDDTFKVVGPLVPREISFQSHDIGSNHNSLREELVIKRQRSNFLKKLFQLRTGRGDRCTRVTKVKVYVDPPKPLNRNDSIGNSTLTWPTDFQKSALA
eukprot:jgi/Psemu1/28227/gm1.28227_g